MPNPTGKGGLKKGPDPRRAKGGKRPGAGRPPNWFKARMQEIASKKESCQFLEDCIDGKSVDRIVTPTGRVLRVPATANVRVSAWEAARDTGFGRPTQEVEHKGVVGVDLTTLIQRAEEERGLDRTV
jgi:hypothetical protein